MSKRLFLQVKWQETKEKNNQKAGGDGCYQEVVEQGGKIALLGLGQDALVKQVNQDSVLLQIPHKGECLLKFDQPTTFSYGDGYQVAGDWVDVCQTYELTLLAPQQQEGVQLEIKGNVLMKVSTTDAKVVVPEGITRIAQSAFAKLLVEEVVLPESVREIGNYAFEYCKFLKKINLPKNLESIGYGAFNHTAVEHFDIPHSLEDLQPYAFCRTPFFEEIPRSRLCCVGKRLAVPVQRFGWRSSCAGWSACHLPTCAVLFERQQRQAWFVAVHHKSGVAKQRAKNLFRRIFSTKRTCRNQRWQTHGNCLGCFQANGI